MFFGHNFPKPEQLTDHGAHSHKKNGGNSPRGSASGCQNVFFLLSRQRGLSATYPAPILTILEKQTWIAFRMRTPVKSLKNVSISAQGVFQVPEQPKIWYSRIGVCDRAAAQTAQLWAIGIISEASRHPKHVPFEREFWWGTYGLGAISPRKSPNFGDFTTWVDLIV